MSRTSPAEAVGAALAALAAGRMVLVTDDDDRENEGDLVMAAEFVTQEQMGFIVRHSTGIVARRCPAPGRRTCGCRRRSR